MYQKAHKFFGLTSFCLFQKTAFFIPNLQNFIVISNSHFTHNISVVLSSVFLTLIGSVFPDIDLYLKYLFKDKAGKKRYLYHRQFTHSLLLWIVFAYYAISHNNIYLFYFTLGVISHLIGDMLTGSIPIFLWGKYYNSFVRIGIDRVYKNRQKLTMFSRFLDKIMWVVFLLAMGYCFV